MALWNDQHAHAGNELDALKRVGTKISLFSARKSPECGVGGEAREYS